MSSKIGIELEVLPDAAFAELIDFSNKVDELGSRWQKVKLTIQSEGTKILRSVRGIISLVESVLKAAGISIGDIGEGFLIIINALISTILTTYVTYQALSLVNPLFIIAAGIALASFLIAVDNGIRVAAGIDDAKEAASRANAIMSSIQSIVGPWRF